MQISAPLRLTLLSFAGCALAGCGSGGTLPTNPIPGPPTSTYAGAAFTATVLSGTTPITGATVQLFAAGTTGNATGATTLLSSPLTTDASGTVSIPSGYPCPSTASQLYLIARGGALPPIAPATVATPNPAIALIAPVTSVGSSACASITASTHPTLNESTTAASVWALSPFLAPDGTLGSTATNTTGFTNALFNTELLIDQASSTPSLRNDTNASLRIHSLANLLNSCITTPVFCTPLFANTSNASDTLAAALNLVRNPGHNVATLYTQSLQSTAFTPNLVSAPTDWTLFRTIIGGGMNAPSGVAIDASGNVWVSSFFGVASKFLPSGGPFFPSGITGSGLGSSYGIALDASDNVWIPNREGGANNGIGTVTELNSAGQPLSGNAGYTTGGLNYPIALATDTNGSTWVVDYGNSHLTVLSSSGQPLSGASGYTSDLFAFPVAIAIDASHGAWVANQGGTTITHVSADGQTFLNSNCCNGASGLAIDGQGIIWVANYYGNTVSRVSPNGAVLASTLLDGGIDHPQAIAIDGAGTAWIANYRGNTLTELAGTASTSPGQALSPTAGYLTDANLSEPSGAAIDASGNLWISNFGADTLTEIIGLATPVKTPLVGPSQTP